MYWRKTEMGAPQQLPTEVAWRREAAGPIQGGHFEAGIIVLCVRWYLRFSLSFRDLEEPMAERNLRVDHDLEM